jgi:hypothetical protein
MAENIIEQLTLIEELDAQQNALLDQLDALNERIEALLVSLGSSLPAPQPQEVPARRAA